MDVKANGHPPEKKVVSIIYDPSDDSFQVEMPVGIPTLTLVGYLTYFQQFLLARQQQQMMQQQAQKIVLPDGSRLIQ